MPVNVARGPPVDRAGDAVGTTRRVLVDRLVHHLWTAVWMNGSCRLTCTDAPGSCGWKKVPVNPWVALPGQCF